MRFRPSWVGLAVLLLWGAACRPDAPTHAPMGADGMHGRTESDGSPRAKLVASIRGGAAHTAAIDMVALSADGTAAVSRDSIGGIRLWMSLDGGVEPIVIPERGGQTISVQRRGEDFVVAVVDAAGGGKVFVAKADGTVEIAAELPPFNALFELHVVPGGDRVVALFKDHTIKLLGTAGAELSSFGERRFRPTQLRVSADGKLLTTVVMDATGKGAELQRLSLDETDDGPAIRRHGSPTVVASGTVISPTTMVVSPDANRVAWLRKAKGTEWEVAVSDLNKDGAVDDFTVEIPAHVTPALGFASPTRLLLSSDDGNLSWLRDLESGQTHARTAGPTDSAAGGRAQVVAGGTHIAALGTWLFVHDTEARTHHFLGYGAMQTQSMALSPTGTHVAWSYTSGQVFVETVEADGTPAVKLVGDPGRRTFRVRFVDDDTLLIATTEGGLRLVRWRTDETIAESGVLGTLRALHLGPAADVLVVERHNGDSWVFELSPAGFGPPAVVADHAYRTGVLTRDGTNAKAPVMWSLDSSNAVRLYSMAALESDLSRDAVAKLAQPLGPGQAAPLAIDSQGRRYGVQWDGSRMQLFVRQGDNVRTAAAPGGDVNQIVPSPEGGRFLAIHQRGNTMSISAHDSATMEPLWTYASGVSGNEVSWSADGRLVGVAASTGAVVLDAQSGETVRRRCGFEFRKSFAAPTGAHIVEQTPSLCEG